MSNRSPANRFGYSLLWTLCWVFCRVWFGFRYVGRGNIPADGPLLVVSNHQSHLDPVLIGVASPRQLRALARHELFFWPLSWLIRMLGAVPVHRERSALGGIKTVLGLLKQGDAVLVFPEGTRTPDGRLQPLQNGFCMLARRSGAAIVPVAIDGAYDAMPRGSSFPRATPINLVFGQAIMPPEIAALTDEQVGELVAQRIRSGLSPAMRSSDNGSP